MIDSSVHKKSRLNSDLNDHDHSNASQSNQSTNQAHSSFSQSILFRYPFLFTILLPLLSDADVLIGLRVTTKSVVRMLSGYRIKCDVPHEVAIRYCDEQLDIQDAGEEPLFLNFTSLTDVFGLSFDDFPSLQKLEFDDDFETFNQSDKLPSTVTHLKIGGHDHTGLARGMLPDGLKQLHVNIEGYRLHDDCFPDTLETLTLESYDDEFFQLQPGMLPASLTSLELRTVFYDCLARDVLPTALTSLNLGEFCEHIERLALPVSLKSLNLGTRFNQPIISSSNQSSSQPASVLVISPALTELVLGFWFNQPLSSDCFPESLTSITIGQPHNLDGSLNHPIVAGVFPNGLKSLILSTQHNPSIAQGVFPSSLTCLHLLGCLDFPLTPGMLPDSLTELHLGQHFDQPLDVGSLPPRLIKLSLGCVSKRPTPAEGKPDSNKYVAPGAIPSSVIELGLFSLVWFRSAVLHIPPSVTTLALGKMCAPLARDGMIPRSVTSLTLYWPVSAGVIPTSVTHLFWYCNYPLVAGVVPESVTHLVFGQIFNREILSGVIPDSVTHLSIGDTFEQSIHPGWLPDNIAEMEVPCSANLPIVFPGYVSRAYMRPYNKLLFGVGSEDAMRPPPTWVNPPSRITYRRAPWSSSSFCDASPY